MSFAVALLVVLVLAGCGYHKRTTTRGGSTTTGGGASTSTGGEAVDLSGRWTLKVTGCDTGDDAWSRDVEVEQELDEITFRFTHYQEELKIVGLITGQKIRAERAVEENDGTLTWITFEGTYHSGGGVIAGDFTDRDGVTCSMVMVR